MAKRSRDLFLQQKPNTKMEALLGPALVKHDGSKVPTSEALRDADYVLIYFRCVLAELRCERVSARILLHDVSICSAHWCPPCKMVS
jgi:hypothetical protein